MFALHTVFISFPLPAPFPQVTSYFSLHIVIFHSVWWVLFCPSPTIYALLPPFVFFSFFPSFSSFTSTPFLSPFCPLLFLYVICGLSQSWLSEPCPILFSISPSLFHLSDTQGFFSQSVSFFFILSALPICLSFLITSFVFHFLLASLSFNIHISFF